MIASLFPQLSTFAYGPQTMAIALAMPLIFLLGCVAPGLRALRPTFLAIAPVPALAASVLAADSGPLVLDQTLFPAVFVLDPQSALVLGACALLWIAAGAYAIAALRDELENRWFAASWLLTLLGNIGVFLAADVVSFYLFFALVSLPAYGLIFEGGDPKDEVGRLYLSLALLGEAFLIVAFVALALAAPDWSPVISDGVAALANSPWRDVTIGLLIAGFGTKIGLIPFHLWMPSTYRAASIPASAVLSGAAVNAGVIGLLRFLPWDADLAAWGNALLSLGLLGAFYGVAIGLMQRDVKAMLAYSSISQMGLVAATLGKGLGAGGAMAAEAAALYATHHGLAKGALFLAVGVVMSRASARRGWIIPIVVLLALSLAGLPPTGGAFAKSAVKAPLGEGVIGALSVLSSVATTWLMVHFVARLLNARSNTEEKSTFGLLGPWLVVTIASVVVPAGYILGDTRAGFATLLDYRLIWEILWPVLAGAALALATWRWIDKAPHAPEGDILVLLQRAVAHVGATGPCFERTERALQRWPVATAALIAIALTLASAGLSGL